MVVKAIYAPVTTHTVSGMSVNRRSAHRAGHCVGRVIKGPFIYLRVSVNIHYRVRRVLQSQVTCYYNDNSMQGEVECQEQRLLTTYSQEVRQNSTENEAIEGQRPQREAPGQDLQRVEGQLQAISPRHDYDWYLATSSLMKAWEAVKLWIVASWQTLTQAFSSSPSFCTIFRAQACIQPVKLLCIVLICASKSC